VIEPSEVIKIKDGHRERITIWKIHKSEVTFHYLTSFAKFPAVNGAEYPSITT